MALQTSTLLRLRLQGARSGCLPVVCLRILGKCRFSRSVFPVRPPAELTLVGVGRASAHRGGKAELNRQMRVEFLPKSDAYRLAILCKYGKLSLTSSHTHTLAGTYCAKKNMLKHKCLRRGLLTSHSLVLLLPFFGSRGAGCLDVCVCLSVDEVSHTDWDIVSLWAETATEPDFNINLFEGPCVRSHKNMSQISQKNTSFTPELTNIVRMMAF